MNYIASCLFTTCIDPLRGIKWDFNPQIINVWYNSGLEICKSSPNTQLIVFHDGLSSEFINQYDLNYINFIQVPECGFYSPHDYRWFIYENFTQNNQFNSIFFTDISDVIIASNPFLDIDDKVLYMGDEQHHTWNNEWALPRNEYYINNIEDFNLIFNSNNNGPFLNAGVLGGNKSIVLDFLQHMVRYSSTTLDKPYNTTDMILFNYVIHKHFKSIKHGAPINSIFNQHQINRKDVWFIHK